MVITVASGKGGTGKTTFAVNLAYALARRGEDVRLLDCDVEEPNDHLFVRPDFTEEKPVAVPKPVWDKNRCTGCGKCADACNYNAIAVVKGTVLIFNELCHSCGVCSYVCPEDALTEKDTVIGTVQAAPQAAQAGGQAAPQAAQAGGQAAPQAAQAGGQAAPDNAPLFFAHGLLNIGEALAPKVVRAVKEYLDPEAINIIDASPGTACPVVEAVEGADAALLVTEPTPFGLHDLKLAVGLTLRLGVPTGIIINRSDADDSIITEHAEEVGLPIAGRIPFRREYAEAYSRGQMLADSFPELKENLLSIYDSLATAQPPVPTEDVFGLAPGEHAPFPVGSALDYKEITVISGKGGTGKTTVVGSLANLATPQSRQQGGKAGGQAKGIVLADNDVDAADLHLLLTPLVREAHSFVGGTRAVVDSQKCIGCGKCDEVCHFDSFRFDGPANDVVGKTWRLDPLACEGCGFCPRVCPVDAIRSEEAVTGNWYVSGTEYGPMVHARLGIAEENSGRLVTQVRNRAGQLADELRQELILGDGPPGTGCPVIASVSGTDLVVIVTEPTVSGVHDMERVMKLAAHFGVPAVVVINKADLNAEQAHRIEEIAETHGSRVIGRIPFDRMVNDALMAGKTVIEYGNGKAEEAIRKVWEDLRETLADLRIP